MGGLFGAGDLTGSVGRGDAQPAQAGLSGPRARRISSTCLTEYAELAKTALEFKRKIISDNLERGLFPWTRRYLKNGFKGHFSTIGLVGGHEACLNLLGKGIETEAGLRLMTRGSQPFARVDRALPGGDGATLYNLEATPAEGTSYRLAKIDKALYSEIKASGNGTPYYTNSTTLPVGLSRDVFYALEHQNKLQPLYTGGTVFHTYLGEAVADTEALRAFIVKAFTLTKIPYLSITPTFSICKTHGYIKGEHFECPTCGAPAEVFTRIVGLLPAGLLMEQGQAGRVRRTAYVWGDLLRENKLDCLVSWAYAPDDGSVRIRPISVVFFCISCSSTEFGSSFSPCLPPAPAP